MGMFQINLCMIFNPLGVVPAISALRMITAAAKVERGFSGSRIYQEVGRPEAVHFEQDWASEPELKSHIRSQCFTDLLMLMETAIQAPSLEVCSVSKSPGLEYVDAVRFGRK